LHEIIKAKPNIIICLQTLKWQQQQPMGSGPQTHTKVGSGMGSTTPKQSFQMRTCAFFFFALSSAQSWLPSQTWIWFKGNWQTETL